MTSKRNQLQLKVWYKEHPSSITNNLKHKSKLKIKVSIQIKANVNSISIDPQSKKLPISGKISIICNIKAWNTKKINLSKDNPQKPAAKDTTLP